MAAVQETQPGTTGEKLVNQVAAPVVEGLTKVELKHVTALTKAQRQVPQNKLTVKDHHSHQHSR